MAKKRLFFVIACVVVLSICAVCLVACKKPANNIQQDVEENVQISIPDTTNPDKGIVEDNNNVPTATLEYVLNADKSAYIVNSIGSDKKVKAIVIPDTYKGLPVTSIAENAFVPKEGENLSISTVVILGANMQTIGAGAFRNSWDMSAITIPTSVKTIGDAAFKNCTNLKNVDLPEGLEKLGDNVFYNCNKLEGTEGSGITIPKNITSISNGLFMYCSSLKKVSFAATIKTIGNDAFRSCAAMETLPSMTEVEKIGARAFMDCVKLTAITIPSKVTTIEDETFFGCSKVAEITLHDDVEVIGKGAFMKCTTLSHVKTKDEERFPTNLETVGAHAFDGDIKLEKISLNQGLNEIGAYAFRGTGLSSVNITSGVHVIGAFAFSDCANLGTVALAESIKFIGEGAFRYSGILPETPEGGTPVVTGREIKFNYAGTMASWKNVLVEVDNYFWGDIDSKIVIHCVSDKNDVTLKFCGKVA